jgi:hypothetical protein
MTQPRDDYYEITEVDVDSKDPNIRGIVGAIVAVNVVIYSGIDDGYDATLGEVFYRTPAVGVVAVALALLGLLAGIAVAPYLRNRRTAPTPTRRSLCDDARFQLLGRMLTPSLG